MISSQYTKYKIFGAVFFGYPIVFSVLFPDAIFSPLIDLFSSSNIGFSTAGIFAVLVSLWLPVTYLAQAILGILFLIYGYKHFPDSANYSLALKVGGVGIGLTFIGIAPCLFPGSGALCGFYEILLSFIFTPLAVVALVMAVFGSGSKMLQRVFGLILIIIVLGSAAIYTYYTPKTYEDCKRLNKIERIESCYLSMGIRDLNPEYCEGISMKPMKDICIQGIVNKTGDDGLCSKLSMHSDVCFLVSAERKNDKSICSRITDEKIKDTCLKRVFRKEK